MKATIAILALLLAAGAGAQWRGSEGPFTREESDFLAEVWPQIREAARFGDINWREYGLARAPGDVDARDTMADNWDELRQARRFDDIDWDDYVGFRDLRNDRERRFAGGFGGGVGDRGYDNPFTREEEAAISRVWGEIRKAASFDDINWRAVGLSRAPGSREARRLMSRHWGQLREAARFEDIDWAATTGQPRRVLR
jgi:hypothetical protein